MPNANQDIQRPIIITPNKQKGFPTFLKWILGCLGGCFILTVFSVFVLSIISVGFASLFATTTQETEIQSGSNKSKIVIIPISGMILDDYGNDGDVFSSTAGVTPTKVISLLDAAAKDNTVKAIILRENTPGGSVSGVRKICDKVISVNKNKPVYSYIESEGASAGYYLASCSKYIIADEQAITGSIGVIVNITDVQGLLDKLGIKTKVITNTQGTSKEPDYFVNNSKDEQRLKQILDQIFEGFLAQVKSGRDTAQGSKALSVDKIKTLATGEIFSGKQAKANGLVDDTGTLAQAVKIILEKEVSISSNSQVVQYNISSGLFGGFASSLRSLVGLNTINLSGQNTGFYAIRQ